MAGLLALMLLAEGHRLVRERLASGIAPGRYQLLAAINAVHTTARDMRDTDWSQVVALYDQLARIDPSPIVALNRAIAVAELDGPEVALAIVDRLDADLAGYHAYHATRADLLRRLGRSEESRAAYDRAIELAVTAQRSPSSRAVAISYTPSSIKAATSPRGRHRARSAMANGIRSAVCATLPRLHRRSTCGWRW